MVKKVIFCLVILILVSGGFFYWQNQADVRELNKTLPEGVRVVKSLLGEEYKVVNKIDGYEFKIPKDWDKPKDVIYKDVTDDFEIGYQSEMDEDLKKIIISESAFGIQDQKQNGVEVRTFKIDNNIEPRNFVENFSSLLVNSYKEAKTFEVFPKITNIEVGQFEVLKLYGIGKSTHGSEFTLSPSYYFLFRNSTIYLIIHDYNEFIKEIILNGEW